MEMQKVHHGILLRSGGRIQHRLGDALKRSFLQSSDPFKPWNTACTCILPVMLCANIEIFSLYRLVAAGIFQDGSGRG